MNLGIIDARTRLLRAALGFALVPADEPERERDKLCGDCARLPTAPEESATVTS